MLIRSIKLAIKIIVSVGILWFLLQKLDISQAFKLISEVNIYVFMSCLVINFAGQYISSIKWGFISEELGFRFSNKDYISYYFTGMFFNLFLPSNVGGDVIKGYYLCKQDIQNKKSKALISLIWDRLTAAVTLVVLCAAGILFLHKTLPAYIDISILLAFAGVMVFLCSFSLIERLNLRESVNIFIKNMSNLNKNKLLWEKILIYTFLFHFLSIMIHIILAKNLGLDIPAVYFLITYPITAIASFLPVSINGVGIREGLYVYLLSFINISYEQAFAFSVLWFLVITVSSLFSVIFYLNVKESVKANNWE